MAKMNLSAPWDIYYRQVEALFAKDPEIDVVYDEDAKEIKVCVENPVKADALEKLLPATKNFGGVELRITVVPANDQESPASLYEKAFYGNPAFSGIVESEGSFKATYVVFKPEVVQYFTDDISDISGYESTVYEDIAREVFANGNPGAFFCTEPLEGIDMLQ